MNLFTQESDHEALRYEPVSMSDVAAYLAERGMVAVPVEPTEALLYPISECIDDAYAEHETDSRGVYRAMIKAAGEQQ